MIDAGWQTFSAENLDRSFIDKTLINSKWEKCTEEKLSIYLTWPFRPHLPLRLHTIPLDQPYPPKLLELYFLPSPLKILTHRPSWPNCSNWLRVALAKLEQYDLSDPPYISMWLICHPGDPSHPSDPLHHSTHVTSPTLLNEQTTWHTSTWPLWPFWYNWPTLPMTQLTLWPTLPIRSVNQTCAEKKRRKCGRDWSLQIDTNTTIFPLGGWSFICNIHIQ
jgi:hypothetical protein